MKRFIIPFAIIAVVAIYFVSATTIFAQDPPKKDEVKTEKTCCKSGETKKCCKAGEEKKCCKGTEKCSKGNADAKCCKSGETKSNCKAGETKSCCKKSTTPETK